MDVYVATKAENFHAARIVMRAIREGGHHITYDWTHDVEQAGPGGRDKVHAASCALKDLMGVIASDVFVFIPHPEVTGALIEMGAALAHRIPVLLLGPLPRPTVFQELSTVRHFGFTDLDKVINWIDAYHEEISDAAQDAEWDEE